VVDLKINDLHVRNSLDYQVWIASILGPNGNYPTFTKGWISIDLNNQPGLFGRSFSQVGIMADSTRLKWFAYSESGVICNYGEYGWYNEIKQMYLGCFGGDFEFVNYGMLHKVELVKYPLNNFWIA
jgi:hypothetical protein